jgi:hypothetical protein
MNCCVGKFAGVVEIYVLLLEMFSISRAHRICWRWSNIVDAQGPSQVSRLMLSKISESYEDQALQRYFAARTMKQYAGLSDSGLGQ